MLGYLNAQRSLGFSYNAIVTTPSTLSAKINGNLYRSIALVHRAKRWIFTDYKLIIRDLSYGSVEEAATIAPQLNLDFQNSWAWNLAPAPELSKSYSLERNRFILS